MRHYLNLKILWGVYKNFDLIPYVSAAYIIRAMAKLTSVSTSVPFGSLGRTTGWSGGEYLRAHDRPSVTDEFRMKWQIFAPIFLLQCINLFWYFLIWRILIR